MKTKLFRVIAGFICIMFIGSAKAQDKEAIYKKKITAFFESYKKSNFPYGFSLLVGNEKGILFSDSYGYSHYENKCPVTDQTKFRLASVSKHFTAALALLLFEKKIIDIYAPIKNYVPQFENKAIGDITLYHLLTNTTGIPTGGIIWKWAEIPSKNDFTIQKFFDSLQNVPLSMKTGSGFNYSNNGFCLAGYILAKVTNTSFESLLRQYIFDPLGMKNSGIDHSDQLEENKAGNYEITVDGEIKPARLWDLTAIGPAGGMFSTLGDLSVWLKALFVDRKVLNENSFKLYTKPFFDSVTTSSRRSYAMGLSNVLVPDENNIKLMHIIEHDGIISGTRTMIGYLPEFNYYYVILSNTGEPMRYPFSFNADPIMTKIGEVMYELPVALKKKSFALAFYEEVKKTSFQSAMLVMPPRKMDTTVYDVSENEWIAIGRGLAGKEKYVMAHQFFDLALSLFPASTEAYYYKAQAFEKAGDFTAATSTYENALKVKEDADIRKALNDLKAKRNDGH